MIHRIIVVIAVMLLAVAGCAVDEGRESDKVDESVEAGLDVAERRTPEKANPTTKEVGAIARASRNIPRATATPRPPAPDVCDIGNAETDGRYNKIVGAYQFSDLLETGSWTKEEWENMEISYDEYNFACRQQFNLFLPCPKEKPNNAAAWFFVNTRNLIRADFARLRIDSVLRFS